MRKYYLILAIFCGLAIVVVLPFYLQSQTAFAQTPADRSLIIQHGLAYLRSQQQADGGILGFSGVSDPDTTARSVMAFVTAGETVSEVVSVEGQSVLDYLASQAISFTHDTTGTLFPGRAGLLLAAISVSGVDPANFGGMNIIDELSATFQPATGAYSSTAKQDFSSGAASDLNQAWSVLGLSLAGTDIPAEAVQYLVQSQAQDGSWGMGDPDTTAQAVTALLTSHGVETQSKTIQNALQFFHVTELEYAGWRPTWDTDPINADSTGWILQALISAGEDPQGESWTRGGRNPVEALMGLEKEDGAIGSKYANTYSTAEAIIGLSERPLASLAKVAKVNRAGLAVFSSADALFTQCISFTEDSISGLDLLERSGLQVQTATDPTQGTAVCKIGDVGEPSNNCFGAMPDYWVYWQLGPDGWEYAVTGASQSKVVDGAVNAWSWSTGNPPALLTFQNICEGVAFVLPTATQTSLPPTNTPQPLLTTPEEPTAIPSQTAPAVTPSQPGAGQYIVYASIVIVLGALIFYVFRSRSKP